MLLPKIFSKFAKSNSLNVFFMDKCYFKWFGLLLFATTATAQTDVTVDYQKYPDYSPVLKPDYALRAKSGKAVRNGQTMKRPDHVNNAETPYFPPVFNQDGGSCGSASRISYMFNYEVNALRGADASLPENQYPSHFTWLLTNSNSGKEVMAAANGIPNSVVYGGRTYSRLFGNQDCSNSDFGWMQGYDKWYHAMCNRITSNGSFPEAVNTESGREAVKNWIWNHNGDYDFYAGGIVGIGVASGGNWQNIPSSPTNMEIGVVGKKFVKSWGRSVDHALTIVGYDDRIEFDLNGDGIVGDKSQDEVGAWIVVNSWGAGWCNNGFIYCPYAHGGAWVDDNGKQQGFWAPEVYYARKNYRPLRTFKIKMEYSKRSELRLSAGIAADINATEPEATMIFEHFKFAGDGDGNGVDAETPMLGRWADGMHYEPMEFGYDLTDFSAKFDTRKSLKYFFIVETKATADGVGKIHNCSLIDYEFDKEGIELPFDIPAEGVTIETQGNKTIISCIVPGEPVNPPLNLVRTEKQLSWNAPQGTQFTFEKYNIYSNGKYLSSTTERQATIEDETALYTVTAVYTLPGGESIESKQSNATLVDYEAPTTRNMALNMKNQGFSIPNLFPSGATKATFEFWIRPTSLTNWNQQMGPGWGNFLFHANNGGSVSVGWDASSNRYNSPSSTLVTGKWQHIAVVIDNNVITLYKDGKEVGHIQSQSYSGIGSVNNFGVGMASGNGINGYLDEFRFWDEARTQEQIQACKDIEIAMPEADPHLLAYYKMSQPMLEDENGNVKLRDHSQYRRHATLLGGTPAYVLALNILNNDASVVADMKIAGGDVYVNTPVDITSRSSANVIKWEWSAPASEEKTSAIPNPSFTFATAGTYPVTLKVTGADGQTAEVTKDVTVQTPVAPEAKFVISATEVAAGDRIMLTNKTVSAGCTYEWVLTGSDQGVVYTTNAAVSYPKEGEYTVTLIARNAAGSSSYSEKVKVSKVQPKSLFSVTPNVVQKGETVYLEDASKYSPDSWLWNLSSLGHNILVEGATGSIVPEEPGVYDISLKTTNDLGEDINIMKRGLVVCNADSKNGLNFSGGSEYVEFGAPFTSKTLRSFTVEWWMNPNRNNTYSHQIGDSEETFLIRTDAMGAMTVFAKGSSMTTDRNVVIPSEWHHYAVTYNYGTVVVWRDGEKVASKAVTTRYAPVLEKFRLSDANAPLSAVVDELRIWNKAINEERVMAYSNAPIADVAAAEADGLLLYCDFNQNSGNVKDATSNHNDGVRVGFGPEGDAWSSTKGVFCLSKKPQDVTAQYLTNYKAPFLHTEATVSAGSRFQELETGTAQSGWKLENVVKNDEKQSTTGFYVDSEHADNLTVMTFTNGFATSLTDHKAYQTITLPAGNYQFTVKEGDSFKADGSYLVVNLGATLPDTEELKTEALAYAPLSGKTLVFSLKEESEVSLGMVINMSGANYLCVSELSLIQSGLTALDANGITGIGDVVAGQSSLNIEVENGGLYLTAEKPVSVTICTVGGAVVYHAELTGSKRIDLQKGIYLVNGKKVIVK